MSDVISYYYSHMSPWTFMGHDRLIELAGRHGRTIDFVPISTQLIFPKTGGLPLAKRPPERRAYRNVELKRWSRLLNVPLNLAPRYFPTDDKPAARLAQVAKAHGADVAALSAAIMRACWLEERDIGDLETLRAIARDAGLDADALLEEAQSPGADEMLEAAAERALADGCFGVPWYVYQGEPFWGQDRLDLLEWTLSGGQPPG